MSRSASEVDFLKSSMEYRLILSLGTKGSGKSFCLCNYLRTCFKYKLYDRYVLVLPAYKYEQNDSYSFIDKDDKSINIFESYDPVISMHLMKTQKKKKVKTLFVIDDCSGENVFNIDEHLQKLITVIRHLSITLYACVHASTGILSPFIRQNTDMLLLSKMTNRRLIENLHEEFLSMTSDYEGREGLKKFVNDLIKLHKEKYQVMYINCRSGFIADDVANWFAEFNKKK
jgi:hypothetical protein